MNDYDASGVARASGHIRQREGAGSAGSGVACELVRGGHSEQRPGNSEGGSLQIWGVGVSKGEQPVQRLRGRDVQRTAKLFSVRLPESRLPRSSGQGKARLLLQGRRRMG